MHGKATMIPDVTTRMVGDGGELYVAAMLNFHGIPTTVMPRGWPGYDLVAEKNGELLRIQVKTANASKQEWKKSQSMRMWNPGSTQRYDWLALVLWNPEGPEICAWLMPSAIAEKHRHDSKTREILLKTAATELEDYKNNWQLVDSSNSEMT
jgi:hypothetical protein